jgi:hypothetical protein
MKTPCSWTPTLARTALGAALLTACGDAPAIPDTDSASGGQTTEPTAPTTTTPPTTADESDGDTHAATDGDSDSATTGPGTLSSDPTTGGCPPDALECAGACVDPQTDLEHCGACDAPCQPGERCELGACVLTCDPDRTACQGACVDTTVDPAHCGACDIVCDPGLSCLDSACLELELCDGVDNDADRSVDEGFPDLDADGTADCVDDACDIADVAPTMVPIDKTCLSPDVVVEDPWNAVIEYQFKDGSFGSWSAPVVGQLTDDNQDGVIDGQDFPDVAISTLTPDRVVALEPATGTVHWSVPGGGGGTASTLIADVNADGKNEVVIVDLLNRPTALDGATGATLWISPLSTGSYDVPQAADVDADGLPEVLYGRHLLNGEDGTVVRSFPAPANFQPWGATMADLDLDGDQEVLISKSVYTPGSNTPLWTAPLAYEGWPVVLNADDDPEAEVAIVSLDKFGVWNHDGSQIHLTNIFFNFSKPGPPAAADFDGDGAVELAWAFTIDLVQVHELDGTKLWSAPISEGSGYAGCSAYDFDGDGAYELLLADEADFRIYDGATGAVRFIEPGHNSNTVYEYPTVADVDNDGSAEILFVSNFIPDYGTLTVLGHPDSAWLPVGPSWGNHDFAVTNLLQNNHVPVQPVPSWQAYNLFRARPSIDDAAVDLTVQVIDACVSGCADSGVATLAVQVVNTGFITVDADIPVTLYRKDGDTLELVDTLVLTDPIPGGTGTAGLLFTVPITSIGVDGLLVRVDDDGLGGSAQLECAESNNEAAWTENPC